MPSSLSRYSLKPKTKRIFEFLWGIFEIIPFIHFYPHGYAHGRSLRHIKSQGGTFVALQMKSFGPKKIQISSSGEKVPFFFFRMGLNDRDLLGRPSRILHRNWKIVFVLSADEYIERLEGKIRKCLFFYLKYSKTTVWVHMPHPNAWWLGAFQGRELKNTAT